MTEPIERALVVTTIFEPTEPLVAMARDLPEWQLVVVGDRETPAGWSLENALYLSLQSQDAVAGPFSRALPRDHYCRKNLGYLHAIRSGAEVIAETDDDNAPYPSFLEGIDRAVLGRSPRSSGWQNVYTHFTDDPIWPRGFPLGRITDSLKEVHPLGEEAQFDCPVQQFLADGDPDVDAIYRLTIERETNFRQGSVVLARGSFCPFNSQNTVWWPDAFPLLYLPCLVSFRMSDIWRSLIAQVCLHAMDLCVAFLGPTVRHQRHAHPLMRDFEQEVPGYLHNERILELLLTLDLAAGRESADSNLRLCYQALIEEGIVPAAELDLVDAWIAALEQAHAGSA